MALLLAAVYLFFGKQQRVLQAAGAIATAPVSIVGGAVGPIVAVLSSSPRAAAAVAGSKLV